MDECTNNTEIFLLFGFNQSKELTYCINIPQHTVKTFRNLQITVCVLSSTSL